MKKCVLLFDELNLPIKVLELKEYKSREELEEVVKVCEENHVAMIKRIQEKEKLLLEEISSKDERIANLETEIDWCKSQIKFLLGEEE